MKKTLLVLFLFCPSLAAFAQLPSIGIKGGANFATMSSSGTPANMVAGSDIYARSKALTSFNVGVFVDVKLGHFSLQPAVNFTGKGGKFDGPTGQLPNGSVSQVSTKYNLYYVQVPVNIVYHVPFVVGEFYIGAGPFVGMGVYGRKNLSADNNNNGVHTAISSSDKITFGDNGDIRSDEYGAGAIAGIKLKGGLLFNLNYDLGLSNVAPDQAGNKFKNHVFGASIGFVFL
ncbi:porin family protein [Mucilaginibacter ginsenosidivorax]|uniref:PorT family protein n=1 Tax=Mucilaginibacter ginsenosidivorax TaxID=862126 RepID=A0A5B8VWJ9_9SPHI|nr:porin family protein [Mucilaginibacter ginsenosidivorax]QEC74995.1 PorT family protein [Mucilaginibacter ginsenosidivorax]